VEISEETQRALKLWVVMVKAFGAVAEQDRRSLARFGLIPSEFAVLEALYHKGPIKLSEIGQRLLLTSGSITYVVDKLEKQGLVRRVACPEDRRAIYAHLTDAGRERIEEVFRVHAERLRHVLSGLSAEEQEIATVLLRKLGLHAQSCAPEPETS
jgi:MarR family transcriptional regulator, 2-MHQ and catechol-resistance regulon repressor